MPEETREEQETLIDLYKSAIGMLPLFERAESDEESEPEVELQEAA